MTDIYTLFPNFKKTMPEFINQNNIFVVYGIDLDPLATSYTTYKKLKEKGMKVYAVNSKDEISGDKIYHNLNSLPEKPDVICIATKPQDTLEVLKNILQQGTYKIWIEIGSETSEAINFCKDNNINFIYYHSLIKELTNPTAEELRDLGKEIS